MTISVLAHFSNLLIDAQPVIEYGGYFGHFQYEYKNEHLKLIFYMETDYNCLIRPIRKGTATNLVW